MAMDNIQKSIVTVLGISGLVAFFMPSGQNTGTAAQQSASNVEALQPPAPVPAPPPPAPTQQENYAEQPAVMETGDAPAFGQPTISGLPHGQEANSQNQPQQTAQNSQPSQSQQPYGGDQLYPQQSSSPQASYDNSAPVN
jgi:hypothetical protein